MLHNYIKIAFRNLWRYKGYSIINILGLTLGITCSSLLCLLVIDELSYDTNFKDSDRIFRLVEIDDSAEDTRYYGMTSPAVAAAFKEEVSGVEDAVRLFQFGGHINFQLGEDRYHERSYFYADDNVFDLFDVEWLAGGGDEALSKPNSIVIDEDWAMRWFGTLDVVGKEVESRNETLMTITGVFRKLPLNSHLQFKILTSLPAGEDWFREYNQNWRTYGAYTYFKLQKQATIESVSSRIPPFISAHYEQEGQRNFYLQPMADIHFKSENIEYASDSNRGNIDYIYILIVVGFFMLVIACINYINLATAKSMHRSKEIGIRKVSGAFREQLITQILSESTIVALISLLISVGLIDLLLPAFNDLTGKGFDFNFESLGSIFLISSVITIVVGVVSGIYPAVMISRLKPSGILKGEMDRGKRGALIRKVLVVAQFCLSIVMIIATIIASNQMDFVMSSDLGFSNENLLIVDINSGEVRERSETVRNEFAKSPYVTSVGVSGRVPGEWKTIQEVYCKKSGSRDSTRVSYIGFDENMLSTYNMKLLKGRNFSGSTANDSLKIIINETLAKELGMEEAIGSFIDIADEQTIQYEVIGVVRDFNFQSMHNEISPIILGYQYNPYEVIDYFSLKFDPEHTGEVVAHASAVHNMFDTGSPIEYHFLDMQWAEFYKMDRQLSNVFKIGAGITIFIACLGLLGLATFIIQKRNKELSVRKVLGASVGNLFVLVSKTFVVQIIVAFVIAAPLSYYLMSRWLDNFAFQTTIGLGVFAVALVSSLGIALLTISYQVGKATMVNPIDKLRDE